MRDWTSEDLLAELTECTSVVIVIITVEDRAVTDLFLMASREHDLSYLWALRKLVKLR